MLLPQFTSSDWDTAELHLLMAGVANAVVNTLYKRRGFNQEKLESTWNTAYIGWLNDKITQQLGEYDC